MSEKNKTKKAEQTKNKRRPKEALGTMQANHKKETWECVLYLRSSRTECVKLAHWASMGKGISWGIFKVRPQNPSPTVLFVQHSSRRHGGGVLRQIGERKWTRMDGRPGKGKADKRQSDRPLPKSNPSL